jgi:threonine dehydrogenase-like Zn-dependent dehydrogenase
MKVKALQCSGKNKLELIEFEKPVPGYDSALLKIKICGICGTDLHGIEGKRDIKYPFIPGHEIVGTIDSIGKDANRFVKTIGGSGLSTGDRVTINPRIVCGKCYYCEKFPSYQEMCINSVTATSIGSKDYPYLLGGFAEYLYVLPGSEIIKLPESLSDEIATLVEPYSVAVGLVDRYKSRHDWSTGDAFDINDTIVVYGIGAIGLLMVAGFSLAGGREIIAVDTQEERLKLSKEFGATNTINVSDTNAEERIKIVNDITKNIGAGVVVESCGVPEVIGEGLRILRRRGILFEVGHLLNAGEAKVDPYIICRNEIKILGHYAYPSSQTMLYAAKILERHEFPYEKLLKFFELEQYREVIFGDKKGYAVKPAFLMGK